MTSRPNLLSIYLVLIAASASVLQIGCSARDSTLKPSQTEHLVDSSAKGSLCDSVILPPAAAADIWRFFNEFEPLWSPDVVQATNVLSLIPDYLQRESSEQLSNPRYAEKLLENRIKLPLSVCQIVGITVEGKRAIFLNFLPVEDQSLNETWRERLIKWYDRGPRYWNVVYLIDEHRFTRLRVSS